MLGQAVCLPHVSMPSNLLMISPGHSCVLFFDNSTLLTGPDGGVMIDKCMNCPVFCMPCSGLCSMCNGANNGFGRKGAQLCCINVSFLLTGATQGVTESKEAL